MDAVILVVQQADPVTGVWLPLLGGLVGFAGIVFAAMKFRPEGALYADAMGMVAELKAQVAEERAKRENLELRLVEAQADRQELEQRIVKLYSRIEVLEAEVGGRRLQD